MSRFKHIEKKLSLHGYRNIAGLDEAGRGPWAGPVVACAVIIENDIRIRGLKDSKQLTALQRMNIYSLVEKRVCFGIGIAIHSEIDSLGLIKATNLAFVRAVSNLQKRPDLLIIDGRDKFEFDIPYKSFIKGDEHIRSICLASIIAKVTRDEIMISYAKIFPQYGFDRHKGYGTKSHAEALMKYGPCKLHRSSYKPIKKFIHA